VIENFLDKGDDILLGGCIANTCIAARGFYVGKSCAEKEWEEKAREIMLLSERKELATVHVPRDLVVATQLSEQAEKLDIPAENVEGDMLIFDIGKVTIKRYEELIAKAGMIVWNGPPGVYEVENFSHGSKKIVEAVAKAAAKGTITILGGGDTIDLHNRYGYSLDVYTFVSTAGGAMLEMVSGKKLPALEALLK